MAHQYGRYWSVVASDDSGNGIDLKDLAIQFVVHHGTYTFPHTANIRIYNLSKQTQNRFKTEFTKVRLTAGYAGNYGVIFQGAVKQVRIGRENSIEGFTDIFAADGDRVHNFGYVNNTLQAGYSQEQVWEAIASAAKPYNDTAPLTTAPVQTRSPRGKVMYGQVRDYTRDWAETNQQLVTIDNGVLTAMPLLAYKPGDAVVINSDTGLVGSPEQTEQGIALTCLLNPAIMWGTRLKLNNDEINQNLFSNQEAIARFASGIPTEQLRNAPLFAPLDEDGDYKALSVDHIGETRSNSWYTQIIAVSVDVTKAVPGTTSLNLGV